ncbi:MAG: DUF4340 domain-containing protein [Chloroflexi bacterium]|nr:DUF4340 domain-containing protein [Chloroflexota bacterium]
MKFRNTLILMVIAVALTAFVFLVERKNPAPAEPGSTPTPTPLAEILALPPNQVERIELARPSAEQRTELVRQADDTWRLVAPVEDVAREDSVARFLDGYAALRPRRVLTGNVSLAEYGLEPPDMTVKFTLRDGTTHEILFGELNADRSARYTLLPTEPERVYLLPSYIAADVERFLNAPPVQPTPTPTESSTIPAPTATPAG